MSILDPQNPWEERALWTLLQAKLVLYAHTSGYELVLVEGPVKRHRKARCASGDMQVDDLEHMPRSLHYDLKAGDFALKVGGVRIVTDHPVWRELGAYWLGLHPLCKWGGNWDRDANPAEEGEHDFGHFSVSTDQRG